MSNLETAPWAAPMRALRRVPVTTEGRSLLGGFAGVISAGCGQWLIEHGESGAVSAVLYVLGIVLFTASGTCMAYRAAATAPARPIDAQRRFSRPPLAAVALLLASGVVLLIMIRRAQIELTTPDAALWPGPVLWVLSMVLLLAASVVAGVVSSRSAWEVSGRPRDRNARLAAVATLAVIVLGIVLARLVGLDRVPLGLLPDEGDRASDAISMMRGSITTSMFSSGWYYISNVYFWLLTGVLHVFGIGYVQARLFGAIASILNSVLIIWMVARHFSLRAGIFAGAFTAFLGVSLQFARLTNEAAPTALLWTVSVALLLEAARRSRLWLWTAAGMAGGLGLYFYPTGRLWAVLAGLYALYLYVRAEAASRPQLVVCGAAMVAGAGVAAAPFLVNLSYTPDELTLRAQQTSIFVHENLLRLNYYNPHWNMAQLLWAQVSRCITMFTDLGQSQGFFPTGAPLMWGGLSVLTLVGIGWVSLSWRDSRLVLLALWFWVGLSGAVVTVETPDIIRIGSAVPVLAVFPALVLESLMRRTEAALAVRRSLGARSTVTAVAGLAAAVLIWQQGYFYFHDYAAIDAWPAAHILGQAVNDQGNDTLVTAPGSDFDMIDWGWTRLLAPYVPRGAIRSPGTDLPLAVPATTNLAFALGPDQTAMLPYLRGLYPGGTVRPFGSALAGRVVTIYRVTRKQWSARLGALAELPGNRTEVVSTMGARPQHAPLRAQQVRWVANWRVPTYDDYQLMVGAGPVRLTIDGREIVGPRAASLPRVVSLALVRGLHHVEYEATLPALRGDALLKWREAYPGSTPAQPWHTMATETLIPSRQQPGGLKVAISVDGPVPAMQRRVDGTISDWDMSDQVGGVPFTTDWYGFLRAPRAGRYLLSFQVQGQLGLRLDGRWLVQNVTSTDVHTPQRLAVRLTAGWHRVHVHLRVTAGPGGIEWDWRPPGGQLSVVPPSALRPPSGAGLSGPVSATQLGPPGWQPSYDPLVVRI